MGIELDKGVHQQKNGINVFQTQDYIKFSAESYIDRMMQTHGWNAPGKQETKSNPVPFKDSVVNQLMKLQGTPEKSPKAKQLAIDNSFSYWNILGELIYAYVICHLNIGYAICFLAQFSESPHEKHYKALKQVCRYLRATKSWGTLHQTPEPLEGLPNVSFEWVQKDPSLPHFQSLSTINLLVFSMPLMPQISKLEDLSLDTYSHRHCLEELFPTCCCYQFYRVRVLCRSYLCESRQVRFVTFSKNLLS